MNEAGEVDDVRLLRSAGHPELDAAAMDALRRSSYTPARRGSQPVPAWTEQQLVGICCRN